MVTYGPWVQDVDHPQWWTISDDDTDNYKVTIARTDDEVDFQEPVYPISEGDLLEVYAHTQDALFGEGAWIDFLSSGYNLSFPKWRSSWGCEIWAKEFYVGSREFAYHPSNYGFNPPEDAIGIDYANQPYTPDTAWYGAVAENVAARLRSDTEFQGKFEDERVAGGDALPWSTKTKVFITPPDEGKQQIAELVSPPTNTSPNWLLRDLDVAIDLAPYGALDPNWTARMHTETHDFVVGGDPAPYVSTRTRYGWMLNDIVLEIDIRPPLYRWVFEGAPYRRNYPRDDGLAGGARRNYPPSKATQYGNRNVGGYL